MSIIIFCKPIHSGKTTTLMHWCTTQENVQGILMPDINGQRMVFNIPTQQTFPIQCMDTNTNEGLISIGKYHFFATAFRKANALLMETLSSNCKWLVIDEIGKLEMQGKGFSDSAKPIIEHYKSCDKNLLLVVRDSLVEEIISFFGINDYNLIHELDI